MTNSKGKLLLKPLEYVICILPIALSALAFSLFGLKDWVFFAKTQLAFVFLYSIFLVLVLKFHGSEKSSLLPLVLVASKFLFAIFLIKYVFDLPEKHPSRFFFILSYLVYLFASLFVYLKITKRFEN